MSLPHLYLTPNSSSLIYQDPDDQWHLLRSVKYPACEMKYVKDEAGVDQPYPIIDAKVIFSGAKLGLYQGSRTVTILENKAFRAMVGVLNSRERISKPMDLEKFNRVWGVNPGAGKVFTDGVTGEFFVTYKANGKNFLLLDLLRRLNNISSYATFESGLGKSNAVHVTRGGKPDDGRISVSFSMHARK